MSGIELLVAKALLSPALSHGGRAISQKLLGDADVNAVVKLCREALAAALEDSLRPFEAVDDNYKAHLLGLLEKTLSVTVEPLAKVDLLSGDGLGEALERAHESASVDWSTFCVPVDGELVKLDESAILKHFLEGLPVLLQTAASRQGSPVFNLATMRNFEEINTALAGISQLLETRVPSGVPLDRDAAMDRAAARQRAALNWRLSADPGGDSYVNSAAVSEWAAWVERAPWTERVLSSMDRVGDALTALGVPDRGLGMAASSLRTGRPRCSSVLIELGKVGLEDVKRDLERALANPRGAGDLDAPAAHKALTTAKWLQEESRSPHFDACFAIFGRFGSGRSRTLTWVAELAGRGDDLSLFLTLRTGESVQDSIIRQSSVLLGQDFSELSELAHFLESDTQHPRMFFLVDDFDVVARQAPEIVSDLRFVIDESTAWPSLRWCISADVDQFDAVVSKDDPYFWVKFGTARDRATATDTGWLDLDELNARQRLGMILLAKLAESDRPDITAILADATGFAYEHQHLTSPLAARIRFDTLDASRIGKPVTDVNNPAFVRAYWTWIKNRLVDQAEEPRLEGVVTGLARAFASTGEPRVKVTPTIKAGVAEGWIEAQGDSLLTLRRAGLLTLTWQGDPEVEVPTQYANVTFPAFWGYRIARTLVHDASGSKQSNVVSLLLEALRPWWVRSATNDALAEASCQFVLTASDEFAPDTAAELWMAWASNPAAPRAPLIMAATGNIPARQQTAIDVMSKPGYKPRSKRELFVALRLIGRSDLKTWLADSRLEVAHRQFVAVVDAGLNTYMRQVLRSVLSDPDSVVSNNFVNVCYQLIGCERVGAAELSAQLMVANGDRVFADDQERWIRCMVRLCQRISAREVRTSLTSKNHSTFLERLLDGFLARIIQSSGADGVRTLAKFGWWTARLQGVEPQVAHYMRAALTTTFGATVHHDEPDAEYHAVVDDLVEGRLLPNAKKADRHEIAFFVIKHSVPTYGRSDIKVSQSLHPALRILATNAELSKRLGADARELYEANHISAT